MHRDRHAIHEGTVHPGVASQAEVRRGNRRANTGFLKAPHVQRPSHTTTNSGQYDSTACISSSRAFSEGGSSRPLACCPAVPPPSVLRRGGDGGVLLPLELLPEVLASISPPMSLLLFDMCEALARGRRSPAGPPTACTSCEDASVSSTPVDASSSCCCLAYAIVCYAPWGIIVLG